MLAILAKLADFRGESRFITWAYRFVILEVSAKLGRHYWRNPPVALDAGQWERLPDRFGIDPVRHAEAAGILAEVRRVVEEELTAHQRRIFVAVVVDQIPRDVLVAERARTHRVLPCSAACQEAPSGRTPVIAGQGHPAAQRHRLAQQPGAESAGRLGRDRGGEEHPRVRAHAGPGDLQGDGDLQGAAGLDVHERVEHRLRAVEVGGEPPAPVAVQQRVQADMNRALQVRGQHGRGQQQVAPFLVPDTVGAENLCHLAGCSADRWLLGPRRLPGRGMIFGLWA